VTPPGARFEVSSRGAQRRLDVERRADGLWVGPVVRKMDAAHVALDPLEGTEWWRLTVNGTTISLRLRPTETGVQVTVGSERLDVVVRRALPVPSRHSAAGAAGGRVDVRSPMPGLVIATPLSPGQLVDQGKTVAVVEAMKMQMDVPAPTTGHVEEVRVRPGQEVAGEQVLVVIRVTPGAAT
jgi:biotin carboxyl carrier protein